MRPEQVWVCDITYIRLGYGFVYLAVIMDVFTRGIRGWHLGRNLDHTLTLVTLQRALAKYAAPEIHHSDQGVQYAATAYTQVLRDAQVQISMADQGKAWQNGYAERLIRTIKEEEVDLSEYFGYHMPITRLAASWRTCTCTSGSILRWAISPQPNSRRSGARSTFWPSSLN